VTGIVNNIIYAIDAFGLLDTMYKTWKKKMLDVNNTVIKIIYKNKILINYYIKNVLNTYLKNQNSNLMEI
jgi:hypothetical protein